MSDSRWPWWFWPLLAWVLGVLAYAVVYGGPR